MRNNKNVHIEVHYIVNDNRVMNQGTFRVKKDEVNTACIFVRQLQRQFPYEMILERVVVDGNKDITKEVLEQWKPPLEN